MPVMVSSSRTPDYLDDSNYPTTYFRELSPSWLNYVVSLNGTKSVDLQRSFTYLELGCGHGYSSLIHAAAFPEGTFHACDINAAYIEAARSRASANVVDNIHFHNTSFKDLPGQNLPQFDFIVLHGVYSWVDEAVRQEIRALIRTCLNPGGLVYVSYNCLPGWSTEVPLRKLLVELARSSEGGTTRQIDHAVRELKRLSNAGLHYFAVNPSALDALETYQESSSGYLSHEFLNETWDPHFSVDVADEMEEAEVELIGSATLVDNHDPLLVSDSVVQSISELPTTRLKQLAMDFAVNRQFRRDVFVHPKSREPAPAGVLGDVVVGCPGEVETIGATVQVPRGRFSFNTEFIAELQRLMQEGSRKLRDVILELDGGRQSPDVARNLTYLIAAGALSPFAETCSVPEKIETTESTEFTSKSVE
ncbi:MAG: methyltransferase regulatory domain-containing protein, partial [Pseudomonadales bacterium]